MHGYIALAGNPNSGKTTIFNALVGAHEHVGNWPGTTVERKEGLITLDGRRSVLVDLPGIYSLTAHALDEKIARDFLQQERVLAIAIVLDASDLERHLYLATQLLEMGSKVILVFNKMDIAARRGLKIDIERFSVLMNVPVVSTTASQGDGISVLRKTLAACLASPEVPRPVDIHYGDIEPEITQVQEILVPYLPDDISARSVAVRLLEGQENVIPQRAPVPSEIQNRIQQTSRYGQDLEPFFAEQRHAYIAGVVRECVVRHLTLVERLTLSDRIDQVVTHRVWGIPIFLAFMYLLFSLVFRLGDPFVSLIEKAIAFLEVKVMAGVTAAQWPAWIGSLITDGVLAGVGNVLVFLPYIMLLYLGISFMQGSGYLARAAFIMDRFMHALGLHGKSFIPMLLGFGCNIPGIMATRTLSSPKDRIITILILPLMSCSARLPVYTLFAAALFPRQQGLVVFSLYLLGIVMAVLVARILKQIFFREAANPLVMELPPYRWPGFREVVQQMFFQAWLFVRKAGTVIFLFVIFVWVLASVPLGVDYASKESLVGRLGTWVAPIFAPAGFGFWQAAVALFFGIMAKEVVIGTLGTLYGVGQEGLAAILSHHFTPLSGYAFLVMTALYIPCVATIATIHKETNWKWAVFAVAYTLLLGWLASVVIYQVGHFFIR